MQVEQELINQIIRIKSSGQFRKYINFIQFPFYRNIEINSRISFDFPLTVFIGQNGCGKSSCLHAMFGAPRNHTPYSFWFDTQVDPIEYYDDKKRRHSFWYGFLDEENINREVVKARIRRNDDPNYWETSRPLAWAGMQTREDQRRDQPIIKSVVYIDFRAELSAFDKFFYFGNTNNLQSRNKQEFIRRKSGTLRKLLSEETVVINTRAGAANNPIHHLSDQELRWVSFILGREYISGEYLEHRLYRNDGYSVVFRTNFGNYTEAFAGSGEVAVVRMVMKVLAAQEYSLILLDEPEVSLHPGAQNRLKLFLLEQIKIKKHQVVITSHSPSIVHGLPKEAIKVFHQNPRNGRFLIKENLTPEEAFYHIEFPIDDRKNIIVEDVLAKEIISSVLGKMGEETKNLFNVKFNPGGESVIKKEFIPVFCREENRKDFVIFDGDQRRLENHYDWRTFSTSELTINYLKGKIREQSDEDIKFSVDGGQAGGNTEQQIELLKLYLDYYLSNVFYLPEQIPEEIIWNDQYVEILISNMISDENVKREKFVHLAAIVNTKQKFAFIAEILQGESSAEAIASVHKQFTQRWLNSEDQNFHVIRNQILTIISRG
jgi:predicted ATPase